MQYSHYCLQTISNSRMKEEKSRHQLQTLLLFIQGRGRGDVNTRMIIKTVASDCASQWRHISTEASQMTADLIVCSTACSDQQQRKSCVLMDLYEGNSLVTSGFISLRANNVVMGHTFPCPDIIITKPQNKTRSYVIHQFLVCSAFYSRPFLVMSLPLSVCQSRVCVSITSLSAW